jgi:arabinose-5-phosphate isomerase
MGKSGHVARKIAATFASTGQPAQFVHPAEANHGDMGMITEDDLVIALSNSGETQELAGLLDYAKRFHIPLVSLTRKKESTLSRLADLSLVIPDYPEACPMGLAPTTSTTMMMALGDALAIALLKAKGFSEQDFKVYHPGGNLGSKLERVHAKMHRGDLLPLVSIDTPMTDVILKISEKGFGCVGVCESTVQDSLVGVITDGDLRRHMGDHLLTLTASDVMTPNPTVIAPDMLMSEALALMKYKRITSLFIVEDNRPIGIIHIHDFLRNGVI